MEVLPGEGTGGGSVGGVGSTGDLLVPVLAPANHEATAHESDSGTIAAETAGLTKVFVDGAAAPVASGAAVPAAAVAGAGASGAADGTGGAGAGGAGGGGAGGAAAPAVTDPSAAGDPAQSAPPAQSNLGSSNATTADLPSVEVLPGEETGGGSVGGVGSTGDLLVPVLAPANHEATAHESDSGTIAAETAGLTKVFVDGAAAPVASGAAVPAAAVAGAGASGAADGTGGAGAGGAGGGGAGGAAAPAVTDPSAAGDPAQSAPPAQSNLGSSNATTADLPSVEVLPGEETSGGSAGGVGSTGELSVPVLAPANHEATADESHSGAVAAGPADLSEVSVDGDAAPAAAGAAVPAAAVAAGAAVAAVVAVAASSPAAADPSAVGDPEQSTSPARSNLGISNATAAGLPSVKVLAAEEMDGGSVGACGSTDGASVPVVAPANLEEDVRQSDLGTIAGETASWPEAVVNGSSAPVAVGAAAPAAAVATAATPPADAAVAPAAPTAVAAPLPPPAVEASLSASGAARAIRSKNIGGGSGEGGRGGGGVIGVCIRVGAGSVGSGVGDGDGGGADAPLTPVETPTNHEGHLSQLGLGTVEVETARLPKVIVAGDAAPADAGTAAPADVAVVAAATPPAVAPVAAAAPTGASLAGAAAGATRSKFAGGSSGGGGGGGDGGGVGAFICVDVGVRSSNGGGGGGGVGRPSAPVVAPANREGDSRQSAMKPVAGETARLPEEIIDGDTAPAAAAPAAASPAAPADVAAAAAGATRSRSDGGGNGEERWDGGSGGDGGHGGGHGAAGAPCAASLKNRSSAAKFAETAAQDIPVCVSAEEFVTTEEYQRQASAPGLVESRCAVPSCVSNAIAVGEETGVVPPSRLGYVTDGCGSGNCSVDRVAAGAPAQALQPTASVAHRTGVNVASAVDGGGPHREAPCEAARKPVHSTTENSGKRAKGAEWLMKAIRKDDSVALPQKVPGAATDGGGDGSATWHAPCGRARRPARSATEHDGKKDKGVEWLLQGICKGDPAARPQRIASAAGGGGGGGGDEIHYVVPPRVKAEEVQTTPQVAASPPTPDSHGMSNITCIVKALVSRLAPLPRRKGGDTAAPSLAPGPQAPPKSQANLGWVRWGVFSGRGGIASAGRTAGERLGGGYCASSGRVAGVPATRAKVPQLAGAWHVGAVHGPSYGGLAPHAYAPCGGYDGRVTSPRQRSFVVCGGPGYQP